MLVIAKVTSTLPLVKPSNSWCEDSTTTWMAPTAGQDFVSSRLG